MLFYDIVYYHKQFEIYCFIVVFILLVGYNPVFSLVLQA